MPKKRAEFGDVPLKGFDEDQGGGDLKEREDKARKAFGETAKAERGRRPQRKLLVSGYRKGNALMRREQDDAPQGTPKAFDVLEGVKRLRSARGPEERRGRRGRRR